MSSDNRSGLPEYLDAFEGREDDFLFYYDIDKSGRINRRHWSRKEFYSLAHKAAEVLRSNELKKGDCFCLCVGANQPLDLAFRLGATMIGAIPATINWQADTLERIKYKIKLTHSRLIIRDDVFKADHLADLQNQFPEISIFHLTELENSDKLESAKVVQELPDEATRITIFTSGTTGLPKGVELPYRSYRTNRATFEQFLQIDHKDRFAVFIVNPLHHANSTAITDWAMRRPGTHIHLLPRYATVYWKILAQTAEGSYDRIVAPTVSRHFDYLEALDNANRLPVSVDKLKAGMAKVDFLIGSAPVGPKTIERLLHYTGRIPAVRFGATETCLQCIGIPMSLPEDAKRKAFEKGWYYNHGDTPQPGYYIGRPHQPHTDARIVKSITTGEPDFMQDSETGRPGYLAVSGNHLMSAYTRAPDQTQGVFHHNWYMGLKDICYTLVSDHDGELDYYWMSRDSMMLIRGGANYAYDQINTEIQAALADQYNLNIEAFDLAVVGLKVESEHEDACCLTLEVKSPMTKKKLPSDATLLKNTLNQTVSKSAKIDYLRFGTIPRNFKGTVLVKKLAAEWKIWLQQGD